MGMFDTVYFECPACGREHSVQSKAGRCVLEEYTYRSVPAAIADDLDRQEVVCDCGRAIMLNSPVTDICMFLTTRLVKVPEDPQTDQLVEVSAGDIAKLKLLALQMARNDSAKDYATRLIQVMQNIDNLNQT